MPDRYDCLPAITAFLNAKAISKGFFAFAIAVFTKTPSHPNSIAILASEAWPKPASIISGSFVCDLIILMFTLFRIPKPEPIGAAKRHYCRRSSIF